MQLYARNGDSTIVFAGHAARQQNYLCLECAGVVRVRRGLHRQTHFYHLSHNASCRLSGKSLMHLQTQLRLCALFQEEIHLEYRFPSINRIADAAWLSRKIVFEIQCSPISLEEVQQRNADYASLGFQVVWILHDSRFNQKRITAAEHYLLKKPFYFTNIDFKGRGVIYDQLHIVYKGMRKLKLPPLPIELNEPSKMVKTFAKNLPEIVHERLNHWPLFFKGDLVDSYFAKSHEVQAFFAKACEVEASLKPKRSKGFKALLWRLFVRPYAILLQVVLERSCK